MTLSDREKAELKALIDADQPLPARYRNLLFADAPEVELIWQGKTREVTNVVLPFQVIEQIDEPRSEGAGEALDLFARDPMSGRQESGWSNKLIWGDNKLVLAALKDGPLRREIEAAGGVKLIYIDPPFDVGADFSVDIEIGEETYSKEATNLEEIAYRDTWGKGTDSFLSMIHERLQIMRDILAEDGSIFVHIDHRMLCHVALLMDSVFGREHFKNIVTWRRQIPRGRKLEASFMPFSADYLLVYSKSEHASWNPIQKITRITLEEAERKYMKDSRGFFRTSDPGTYSNTSLVRLFEEGRIYVTNGGSAYIEDGILKLTKGSIGIKYYRQQQGDFILDETVADNIWDDIPGMGVVSGEYLGYPTQKPLGLLKRVIKSVTSDSDLVCDFFCGSGTTMAVAEELGRKWIGCDLGRFAIHTSRKRLIGVQRELKKAGKPYRAFEILNLGKYERQWFIGVDPTLPDAERAAQSREKEARYLDLICQAYKVTRVPQHPVFHGRRGSTMVVVGPVDAPVTEALVQQAIDACRQEQVTACDILGFDWEMGLSPRIQEDAGKRGVALALKYIPRDVFDKRAVEKGEVQFYDVAYVEAQCLVKKRTVTVTLQDFGVFYRQDDLERLTGKMKPGSSKVVVDAGAVQKLTKAKDGSITTEILTKHWEDWIDYWAVDFDYGSRQEIVRWLDSSGTERQGWTGNFIFENEWQSYRTRKDRSLELTSAPHEYPAGTKGKKRIAVKVIDIFGNDTTKVFEVHIK